MLALLFFKLLINNKITKAEDFIKHHFSIMRNF